jgi:hypothetical protein
MTGAETIAGISVIGTCISGVLTTLFHSRCSRIECCSDRGCISCERKVLSEEAEEKEAEKTK